MVSIKDGWPSNFAHVFEIYFYTKLDETKCFEEIEFHFLLTYAEKKVFLTLCTQIMEYYSLITTVLSQNNPLTENLKYFFQKSCSEHNFFMKRCQMFLSYVPKPI